MTGRRRLQLLLWLFLLQCLVAGSAAALQPASPAPRFELNDLQGRAVRIAGVPGKELLLLFFFDAESRSSLECLKTVNALARRHPSRLAVYGISASPPGAITGSLATHDISIPVLRATAPVRELYQAGRILPVGCVIGRDFKVLSYYQGGGEGFTSAVVASVERELRPATPPPATFPAAKPVLVKKAEPAGKRQSDHRPAAGGVSSQPATEKPATATPAAGPAAPVPAAATEHPRTRDRSSPQNSVGKILNDNEW